MKIRSGFVSNSSSSSFIISLEKIPKNSKELRKDLFIDSKTTKTWDSEIITIDHLSSELFKELKTIEPICYKEDAMLFCNGALLYMPDLLDSPQEHEEQIFINNFLKENENNFIYCLMFSDGGDPYRTIMDHKSEIILSSSEVFKLGKYLRFA